VRLNASRLQASPAMVMQHATITKPPPNRNFPPLLQPIMPASPADLFAFLDRLGIQHQTVSHPALFTVEESRALRGKIAGGHSKNLFVRDKKGALYLVVALEDATIPLNGLHRLVGASGRFSFGSAEAMRAVLGVEPGSVTPFATLNDTAAQVTVLLDAAMLTHDRLNFHPLINTMTTTIARDDLLKFLAATGHPPRIEAVSAPAQG
jgi:Ala-tRNA(Pro) deacylase